ncbi:adenylate kinase [Sandaracinomonas limnophila]|uniref:Adenylate kinase n=1 Tax=Sandaracinomonas limnophila TaxID=1862386 RepID=A0A437PMK8_9BACT|nr:adenylate kinase [Sandaracinomonas limnophila]RVU23521.1 adenylate kinase [Sandaracinomonas limnophila]
MINLVLFGPPGAGKGTQSENIIQKFGLIHLSTGDLLRAEIGAGTALGLEAKKLMDQGILVPDAVVIGMIENKINDNKTAPGFIFDGFPRTVAQAEALDQVLAKHDLEITTMIALEVNEEVLTSRLLERGKTSGRPDDQNEELIRKRVQEYNNKTAPVANYYLGQHKFNSINGIGEIDQIFAEIVAILES